MPSNKKDQDLLKALQKELDELEKKHINVSFPTPKEIQAYIKDNQLELSRLKQLYSEVKTLKWKLMTDREKKAYQEYKRKMIEKYSHD